MAPSWLSKFAIGVVIAGILSDFLPVTTGLPWWRRLSRGMRFTAACTLVMLCADLGLWWMSRQRLNNLWLVHLGVPVYATLTLLGLAAWQRTANEARTLQWLAAAFVIVWLFATLRFENLRRFSNIGRPLCAFVLCTASAYTLFSRARDAERPLAEEGWFWICAGWIVLYATSVLLNPVANLLLDANSPLLFVVYILHSSFNIVANVLLMIGFLRGRVTPLESVPVLA